MPSSKTFADLPCTLPTLKYLGWESEEEKVLYKLEHKDGKVFAIRIEPFNMTTGNRADLFLSEAGLDHFGAAACDW